jgi:hemoglobin
MFIATRLRTLNNQADESVYELVGGLQWFHDLCSRFYQRVATDEVLRPLYPDDLEPSRHRLALFLAQYWGGPGDYSIDRGHPKLRMRHMHLRIGAAERDCWYHHMAAAVSESRIDADLQERMLEYFSMAANHLVNSAD